jgi:hypothetical protein
VIYNTLVPAFVPVIHNGVASFILIVYYCNDDDVCMYVRLPYLILLLNVSISKRCWPSITFVATPIYTKRVQHVKFRYLSV